MAHISLNFIFQKGFLSNFLNLKARLIVKSKRSLNYENNLKRIKQNFNKQLSCEDELERDYNYETFNLTLSKIIIKKMKK